MDALFVTDGRNFAIPVGEILYVQFEGVPGAGVLGYGGDTPAVIHLKSGNDGWGLSVKTPEAAATLRRQLAALCPDTEG